MRVKKISIGKYKNLVDFKCDFSGSNISAFIGNNGSGKSNLLEVISRAFSNAQNIACGKSLPLIAPKEKPELQDCVIEYSIADVDYILKYNCNMEELVVDIGEAPDSVQPVREMIEIWHNGKKLTSKEYKNALPETVLIYYAGETLRQRGIAETTYDTLYETRLKRAKTSDLPGLKFIDCYNTGDLTLLLVAASAYKGSYYQELLELIGCNEISTKFSVILRKPPKGKGAADTYWGATGFVKEYLDVLRKDVVATRDAGTQYYMFFDDSLVLKKMSTDELDLFAKLKVLKHYGYLEHIGIEFVKNNGPHFSSLRLSEGEKQLSLLYLLLSFSAKHECLYLFDEFDSYLHPSWQRSFIGMVRSINFDGYMIFTTHSPLSLTKMEKEEIKILVEGDVYEPNRDPYNRDVSDILTELMDVSRRPPDVEEAINKFKQAIYFSKKEKAIFRYEQLQEMLSADDPFFLQADALMEDL